MVHMTLEEGGGCSKTMEPAAHTPNLIAGSARGAGHALLLYCNQLRSARQQLELDL